MNETGDFQCKICGTDLTSFSSLHRHLKKDHGTSPVEYYPLFFDKRDKFDGELIPFKDIKSYFSTDFNSKYNLLKWASTSTEEVKEYILEILINRAKEKETNLIPSHLELKSLFAPSLSDYITIFGGVDKFSYILGENGLSLKLLTSTPELKSGEMKIFIDTREKNALSFPFSTQVKKAIVGDYFPSEEFFCNVGVERKSLFDLAGTLTSGIDRFTKEIERASELGFYLVVVVESSFTDAFNYSPKNSFSQRIGGAYLFNKIRKIMTDYNNIQFVFSSNRHRSVEIVEKIFRAGEAVKTMDLEWCKDMGLI